MAISRMYFKYSQMLHRLGNTASSASYLTCAHYLLQKVPPCYRDEQFTQISIHVTSYLGQIYDLRHPGPNPTAKPRLVDDEMQIYGSWCVTSENHMYDDIWSWDIAKKEWTKEKSHGNRPAPRSEMAAIYVRIAVFAVSHSDY